MFGASRRPHWIEVGRGRSQVGEATGREGNEQSRARSFALYPRSSARRINSAGITIAMPNGLAKERRSRSDATTNSALAANAHARNESSLGSRLRRFPRGTGTQCNALWLSVLLGSAANATRHGVRSPLPLFDPGLVRAMSQEGNDEAEARIRRHSHRAPANQKPTESKTTHPMPTPSHTGIRGPATPNGGFATVRCFLVLAVGLVRLQTEWKVHRRSSQHRKRLITRWKALQRRSRSKCRAK